MVFGEYAARQTPSWAQALLISVLALALGSAVLADGELTLILLIVAVQAGFLAAAGWRALLLVSSLPPSPLHKPSDALPRYTILVALFQEAEVAGQLVERLSRIDYPRDQLEGFLLLEADDHETRAQIDALQLPPWLSVTVAPDGVPRTKPRALNLGLAAATGELVTVYDAEDDPDPLQLREAAAAFAAEGSADLWALQAPLRIRAPRVTGSAFLDRQFAIEYASLFEVTLPGLARLGLPFPLGGTSNHFRVAALRAIGGWDSHNVTEDADIGFRIWRGGGRLDVLSRPTYEPPPGDLEHWLPQRTRWLKGFMQTWGVHTRDVRGLGWRGGIALTMTLGAAIASAAVHALSLAWLLATVLIAMAADLPPETPTFAMGVLAIGTLAAWVNAAIGCRRAGMSYTLSDMISAPAYWSLLSLAFVHAVWRLISEPFAWDKTAHFAEPASRNEAAAGREAA
ncbi:glycosyltransferase family 2 protein [Brevundimonas bacteroides]|uniref:glycosyltransferase family 2 protein n=1 Tax=Brevundimonas bacteroides TaxID=74311 RepID=UPI000495D675|nr:glycosyltransferase [Brevundimonas bacteroides]